MGDNQASGGVDQAVFGVPRVEGRGVGSLGEGTACDKENRQNLWASRGRQLGWHTPDEAGVVHCGQDQVKDLDWVPGLLGNHRGV